MTDDYVPDPEELLEQEAKQAITKDPEPIPDAQGLPADVRDGHIEDTP